MLSGTSVIYSLSTILVWIVLAVIVSFIVLIFRVLLKFLRSGEPEKKWKDIGTAKEPVKKNPLNEVLKTYRIHCNMTQEFIAGQAGVSRQAVSKWVQGFSEPSTSNLLAFAKVFGVSAADLLNKVE